MAGEVRLVVRVAVLGADVGLAGQDVLTTCTDGKPVGLAAAAEAAAAPIGVAALKVQMGLGQNAEVDAPAGVQVTPGLDAALLGGRIARLDVHAERNGVADCEVEAGAGAKDD